MKKLIAIALTCIFCADVKAQTEIEVYKLISDNKKDTVQVMTVDDLFEYQRECYNDSTLIHQHYMPKGDTFCIVDWECLNTSHYRNIWIHKEPTFEGFMVWLRKKYNYN